MPLIIQKPIPISVCFAGHPTIVDLIPAYRVKHVMPFGLMIFQGLTADDVMRNFLEELRGKSFECIGIFPARQVVTLERASDARLIGKRLVARQDPGGFLKVRNRCRRDKSVGGEMCKIALKPAQEAVHLAWVDDIVRIIKRVDPFLIGKCNGRHVLMDPALWHHHEEHEASVTRIDKPRTFNTLTATKTKGSIE